MAPCPISIAPTGAEVEPKPPIFPLEMHADPELREVLQYGGHRLRRLRPRSAGSRLLVGGRGWGWGWNWSWGGRGGLIALLLWPTLLLTHRATVLVHLRLVCLCWCEPRLGESIESWVRRFLREWCNHTGGAPDRACTAHHGRRHKRGGVSVLLAGVLLGLVALWGRD